MSEVQALAELGLLPNQLNTLSQQVLIPSLSRQLSLCGNLTGPTSYAGLLWGEDAKQPQRLRKDSGRGIFVHLFEVQPMVSSFCLHRSCLAGTARNHPKDEVNQERTWGESENCCGLEELSRHQVSCSCLTGS